MKNIFILIIILVFKVCSLDGQILTINYGPTYFAHKAKTKLLPELIGERIANDAYFYKIAYEHYLKDKLMLSGSFSKYPIYTFFRFHKENEGGSVGWSGTNVKRFDIAIQYNIFSKSKFIVQPSIGLGIQKSIPDGSEIIGNDIPAGIKPEFFELSKPIESASFSNTQIVPVVGIKFGYAFWGRLELFMDIQQVLGYKIIQELRMSYTYKGIEQPQAISYSDGTGRFYALGIGYRFVKPKVK